MAAWVSLRKPPQYLIVSFLQTSGGDFWVMLLALSVHTPNVQCGRCSASLNRGECLRRHKWFSALTLGSGLTYCMWKLWILKDNQNFRHSGIPGTSRWAPFCSRSLIRETPLLGAESVGQICTQRVFPVLFYGENTGLLCVPLFKLATEALLFFSSESSGWILQWQRDIYRIQRGRHQFPLGTDDKSNFWECLELTLPDSPGNCTSLSCSYMSTWRYVFSP